MTREWDPTIQEEFYSIFPEVVGQEIQYELLGAAQNQEQNFAENLVEPIESLEEIEESTRESLETELDSLSSAAVREAGCTQNIVVYHQARTLWEESSDNEEFLNNVEEYVEKQSGYDKRDKTAEQMFSKEPLKYGTEQEYTRDIKGHLMTKTIQKILD